MRSRPGTSRSPHRRTRSSSRPTRRCSALSGYETAFAAHDWDWFNAAIHPDVVSEDRRTGIGFGTVQGREALIALTSGLAEVGFETVEHTPLAVRGERLFLARRTFRTPTGFDLELLGVLEADDEGRLIRHVQWDPGGPRRGRRRARALLPRER